MVRLYQQITFIPYSLFPGHVYIWTALQCLRCSDTFEPRLCNRIEVCNKAEVRTKLVQRNKFFFKFRYLAYFWDLWLIIKWSFPMYFDWNIKDARNYSCYIVIVRSVCVGVWGAAVPDR